MKQASDFWVSWTPWFFINNQFLWWAYPFDSFKAIIDAELAK
jgi:protein-disulfide isomerase